VNRTEILGTREWGPTPERPWTLRLAFGLVDGQPAVVGVEVYAVDTGAIRRAAKGWPKLGYKPATASPITSTGLRLPLGELLEEWLSDRQHRDRIMAASPSIPAELRKLAEKQLALLEGTPVPSLRRATYGREHYERVAAIYLEALQSGQSPTKAVEREIPGATSAQATKWVARARQLGLLPPTVRGKAAGWPSTPARGKKGAGNGQ
jgi:hypothetical protein